MSQSNMNGFISDEEDEHHALAFPESRTAAQYLKRFMPNEGDRKFFGYNEETEEWVLLVNKGGRLWIEVGEAAA